MTNVFFIIQGDKTRQDNSHVLITQIKQIGLVLINSDKQQTD